MSPYDDFSDTSSEEDAQVLICPPNAAPLQGPHLNDTDRWAEDESSEDEYAHIILTGPLNFIKWERALDRRLSGDYDDHGDLWRHVTEDYAELREEVDQQFPSGYNFAANDVDRRRRMRGALFWARKNAFKEVYDSLSPDIQARLPSYMRPDRRTYTSRDDGPSPKQLFVYLKKTYGPRSHMAPMAEMFAEIWETKVQEGEDPRRKLLELDGKIMSLRYEMGSMTVAQFFDAIEFHAVARALPPSYSGMVQDHVRDPTSTIRGFIYDVTDEYDRREREGVKGEPSDEAQGGPVRSGRLGDWRARAEQRAQDMADASDEDDDDQYDEDGEEDEDMADDLGTAEDDEDEDDGKAKEDEKDEDDGGGLDKTQDDVDGLDEAQEEQDVDIKLEQTSAGTSAPPTPVKLEHSSPEPAAATATVAGPSDVGEAALPSVPATTAEETAISVAPRPEKWCQYHKSKTHDTVDCRNQGRKRRTARPRQTIQVIVVGIAGASLGTRG
jgi:hypothetical protein